MAYPIKYIENNLVWNKDGECYAYYELVPYNYSFLSPEQKIQVHDSFRQLIAQNRDGKIHALQISTESSIRSAQERSKNEVTGNVRDLTSSISQTKADRASGRKEQQEQRRKTIAKRRSEMEQVKQKKQPASSVHERPTTRQEQYHDEQTSKQSNIQTSYGQPVLFIVLLLTAASHSCPFSHLHITFL